MTVYTDTLSRRDVLKMAAVGGMSAALFGVSFPVAGQEQQPAETGSDDWRFQLPALPYAEDALEPYIDARTMGIHHGKHHAGYTDKLNTADRRH